MVEFVEFREYVPNGSGMRMSIDLSDISFFSHHKESNKVIVQLKSSDRAFLVDCDYDDLRNTLNVYRINKSERQPSKEEMMAELGVN